MIRKVVRLARLLYDGKRIAIECRNWRILGKQTPVVIKTRPLLIAIEETRQLAHWLVHWQFTVKTGVPGHKCIDSGIGFQFRRAYATVLFSSFNS